MRLKDAKEFHKFLDLCHKKLVLKKSNASDRCGFFRWGMTFCWMITSIAPLGSYFIPIPSFQDQRRICGAVHCEGGDEVCPALLLWGRDRTSQAQVRSGGWVSLWWPHLGSLTCFDHLIDQVGSGLPEVLLQGSGDQERALCQRCLQGEQRGVFYFWRICEKHPFQKIRADILAEVSCICISTFKLHRLTVKVQ